MPTPWFFFGLIAGWMVLACLKVIGTEYGHAVAWHDLRVRVQLLRRRQQQRLETVTDREPTLRRITRGSTQAAVEMPSLTEAANPVEDAVEVLTAKAA